MANSARRYKNSRSGRVFAISGASVPRKTVDEIAAAAQLANPEIRVATVGAIRAAGYRIARQGKAPWHVQIVPPDPSVNDWRGLDEVLGQPIRNPAKNEEVSDGP